MVAVVTRRTRRLAAILSVLVVFTASCSDKQPATPATVGTTLVPAPGDASPPGASGATTTGRPSAPTSRVGVPGDGTTTSATDESDLKAAARGVPGGFAGILLAPGPAASIVLDVLVQPGVNADEATLAAIRQIVASASAKPVTVRGPTALNAAGNVYTAADIRRLADTGRPQGDGTAVVHLLYLRGQFSDDSALGVSVRGDALAVFPEQIARVASPLVSRARVERAVVTHELGHILGLVDVFLDDNRDDPEHPGHSTNPQSVMYWAVESNLVAQVLNGPPPVTFDAADQNDLRRIHEGAPRAG